MKTREPASNYDKMVYVARDIFLEYDQEKLIRKFQLSADDEWIYLEYLKTSCRISRESGRVEEELSAGVWSECCAYNTVMTIYDLLCYSKGDEAPVLSGEWCTSANFLVISGSPPGGNFTQKFAELFQKHKDGLKMACENLGGIPHQSAAKADIAYMIPVTSYFPVVVQLWEGDEEFPPELLLLWDKNAMDFLHFETSFFLQFDLLSRLENQILTGQS